MKRGELILASILVIVLLAGVTYESWHGGPKSADVIVISGDTTPFDQTNETNENTITIDAASPETILKTLPIYSPGLAFLNQATPKQLESLPGIGTVIAQRIIDYRSVKLFGTIEDLKNVQGIGDKKFQDIADYLQRMQTIASTPKAMLPFHAEPRPLLPRPVVTPSIHVDINRATKEQLMAVSGIGPSIANSILEERARKKGFRSWDDVSNVSGIGEQRLKLLQKQFTLN